MPVYFYWGEDDFTMAKVIKQLKQSVLDEAWLEFNFQKYSGIQPEDMIDALNDALTPPFGTGGRFVWLENTTITSVCPSDLYDELERTLPQVSDNSHLLLSTSKKPDGRLKSTKLLNKIAQVREFSLIPYWDEKAIRRNIENLAQEMKVKIAPSGIAILQDFVGNDSRRLGNELEKLSIYQAGNSEKPIDAEAVNSLVICNTQNSLKLAQAVRDRNLELALILLYNLLEQNEPPLKIIATLSSQLRLWTKIKIVIESGISEYSKIAKIAEIKGNPNRIKYILQDLESLNSQQLLTTFPLLLDLEYNLKKGAEPRHTLSSGITKIYFCLQSNSLIFND